MFPLVPSPDSFHGLVGRLAADGGELLRRLAVEHEKEVARLHAEIGRLQADLAQLGGCPTVSKLSEPRDLLKTSLSVEASSKSLASLPKSGRETQAPVRRSGEPDENALAKALSFVDALHEDRSLMRAISVDRRALSDEQAATRVLKVATEIAELARERGTPFRGQSPEEHSFVGGGVREFRHPRDMEEVTSPGIKLSSVSPPVKAPDRMPEPPDPPLLLGDEDSFTLSRQPLEVLDERLKLSVPFSPRLPEDDMREHPANRSNLASGRLRHNSGDSDTPQVPVFLNSVSKPNDDMLMEALGHDALRWARETSGLPPRETTTWQPLHEASREPTCQVPEEDGECREGIELPFEPDSPESPPRETMNKARTVEQPSDDWRSLLQVQGSKWRPSGDDGVSIAMYLESTPKKGEKDKDVLQDTLTPTSI
mmetsp:Transcript_125068/g.198081  ORF Transcript_125068/g.198081 Transcript_125068/m.198081 type:complete len:426 (-) Transcript_125068:44-1321(-)